MAANCMSPNWSFNRKMAIPLMLATVVCICCDALFSAQLDSPDKQPLVNSQFGVIVDGVAPNWEGQDAGLLYGDVILSWSRGKAGGRIKSPFDWDSFLVEHAPRGSTTLRGLRDGHEKSWTFPNRYPGFLVQPALRGELYPVWLECRELEWAGKFFEAAEKWRSMVRQIRTSDPPWMGPWFQFQLARALERAGELGEADLAFRRAIEQARSAVPTAPVLMFQAWGRAALSKKDYVKAEESFRLMLAEARSRASPSLEEAKGLYLLGVVVGDRGEDALQEGYQRQALAIYDELAPDSGDCADTLYSLGWLAQHRIDSAKGDLPAQYRNGAVEAEKYYRQALAIWQRLAPGDLSEVRILTRLGEIASAKGDSAQAEEDYRHALELGYKKAPETAELATIFSQLGYLRIYDAPCKGAEYFQKAVAIYKKLDPNGLTLATAMQDLGLTTWGCGDFDGAEAHLKDAMQAARRIAPDSLFFATSEINLSGVVSERGQLAQAEGYLREALSVYRRLQPMSIGTAVILGSLAEIKITRGDLDHAEEYMREALILIQKLAPGSVRLAGGLAGLGNLEQARNNLAKAEDYYGQALAIWRKLTPSDYPTADVITRLGAIAESRGDLRRAEQYYGEALAIQQKLAPASTKVAWSLASLGGVAEKLDDVLKAKEYYRGALTIQQKLAPGSLPEAKFLNGLGRVLKRHGDAAGATTHFSQAVDALETQTARLGGTEEVRSDFRSTFNSYYRDLEGALLEQNQSRQAYQILERSRAQSLLHMLAERDLLFAGDLPADLPLSKKRNAAEYDRTQAQLSRSTDEQNIATLRSRLRDLAAEREQIAERIKKASPRFASLQYPQPLDWAGTRDVLDAGTALLSFSVGEEQTILFVILPKGQDPGLSVFVLPAKETTLRKQVEGLRKLIQQKEGAKDRDFAIQSRELYDLLLKPAEAVIGASRRLLVVPDGPLQVLPFSALLREPDQYVAEWKPVHTVVSATVYAELKKTRRATQEDQPIELAAFGDPLYPAAGKEGTQRLANPDLAFAEERGFTLARLPFSRQEVVDIGSLFAGHSRTYLGAEATEEHAKALGKDVRYIHFATHGLLDERFPLNSALVLTIPAKIGEGQDNGLLQAWEIFEQMRLDADLVTLSACNTGMGQELSGEGLIGLTRAFQYAGARSILASLWSVDDLWTMELMKDFYGRLKAGSSKDVALQTAQAHLIHSRAASSPYYWAAFSLIGDWQ
jgi:CHAT domain-containing protein/Flp pilus assembly protein TadD